MSSRSRASALTVLAFLCAASFASAQNASKPAAAPKPALKLKVGDVAPDFTLKTMTSSGLKDVSLHDYKGKKDVVLAFYVFAFTGG
jgi:cytochrome oxidase Cu insertion factor (SCO1/SenC/PrrC family)